MGEQGGKALHTPVVRYEPTKPHSHTDHILGILEHYCRVNHHIYMLTIGAFFKYWTSIGKEYNNNIMGIIHIFAHHRVNHILNMLP